MNPPVLYLAQKYRGIEQKAFENACEWALQLLTYGFKVISPITHSHPIARHRLSEDPEFRHPEPDWLANDLALLGAMCQKIPIFGDMFQEQAWYQPNVIAVFADDCLSGRAVLDREGNVDGSEYYVDESKSKGAYREWLKCQELHIRTIRLADVLNGIPIEQCPQIGGQTYG